jgi:prepilin-type processing-associated H-X9-DG protein
MNQTSIPVHTQGANYLATDGHVKWLMPGRVSGGFNNPVAANPEVPDSGAWPWYATGTSAMDIGTGASSATITFSQN